MGFTPPVRVKKWKKGAGKQRTGRTKIKRHLFFPCNTSNRWGSQNTNLSRLPSAVTDLIDSRK